MKRKYKEISHSHYKMYLEDDGGNSWYEILSRYGKALDNAEHKINPSNVIKISIENGEIHIQTMKCAVVDLDAPLGEKVKEWVPSNV